MKNLIVTLGLLSALAGAAAADTLKEKKEALIAEMNKYDCRMDTPQADISMPQLGITRPEAIALAVEMQGQGIAKLDED
ncbi:MAG: hypothetical protein AAF557_28465, partial [Pseudomonadota bacterium]